MVPVGPAFSGWILGVHQDLQAVEKALKALHLHHGQQSGGHGLGRSFRDLPVEVASCFVGAICVALAPT